MRLAYYVESGSKVEGTGSCHGLESFLGSGGAFTAQRSRLAQACCEKLMPKLRASAVRIVTWPS